MNDLQIFNNTEFGEIRTVEVEGKFYFIAVDIARSLGYQNTSKAISDHCKGVTKRYILTNGGKQQMNVIPEGDIYRLIVCSELPSAEKFESWIFDEVLPTIRKTGTYTVKANDKLKVQEMNALWRLENVKVKKADMLYKLSNVETLSKEYKNILVGKATEVLTGQMLLPMARSEQKTYSATELGDMLGVTSQKIGVITNKYNLKTEKYGEWYRDKSRYSNKEVDSFRYFDSVIPALEELIGVNVV